MGSKARIKLDELETDLVKAKGIEFVIGRIIEEWEEKLGPTPMPSLETLREWDLKLLNKYKPFYLPFCELCCLCTMGKCDLSKGKRGACGLDMAAQQSRIVLLACWAAKVVFPTPPFPDTAKTNFAFSIREPFLVLLLFLKLIPQRT